MNESQRIAILAACDQRVTLIQGPPGTGKTRVLAFIAALMNANSKDPILVCSALNETADLLYEALEKHDTLKGRVMRVYSRTIERKMTLRKIPFVPNSLTNHMANYKKQPFKERKEIEDVLFANNQIIVTTCGAASD